MDVISSTDNIVLLGYLFTAYWTGWAFGFTWYTCKRYLEIVT